MGNVSHELLGFFLEEATEHLSTLERGLLRLEKDPADRSVLDELFRSAHTIKGSAALVKLKVTSTVAHRLEDTLEDIRDGKTTSSRRKVDAMLLTLDRIKELVAMASSGEPEPESYIEEVERALQASDRPAEPISAVAEEAEPVLAAEEVEETLAEAVAEEAEEAGEAVLAEAVMEAGAEGEWVAEAVAEDEEVEGEALAAEAYAEAIAEAVAEEEAAAVAEVVEAVASEPVYAEAVEEAEEASEAEAFAEAMTEEATGAFPEAAPVAEAVAVPVFEGVAEAEPVLESEPAAFEAGSAVVEAVQPAASEAEEGGRAEPLRAHVPFTPERRMPGRRAADINLSGGGMIKINAGKLDGMMNTLGEITIRKNHLVNQLSAIETLREEIEFAQQRLLREVNSFSERYAYSLPEQVRYKDALLSEFMELEFDRYDELNLFSRKLQEITNDINEGFRSLGNFFLSFSSNITAMDRMISDMKEKISDARMIDAGTLFQRFTRTVRDLSRETGKEINFLVSGGDTPLDRVVFDGLFDPLLHIIRNAAAHGFEPPEERLRSGKPAAGTIRLAARREGNTVVIDVRDDGRGIQFEKIRARAIEKGMLAPDVPVSSKELIRYLFMPGFTTSDAADLTSGRGVGLDVVKDRLAQLNGTVSILTKRGKGTIFRMRLPLSLIIINVIHFKVASQDFVIPSNLVVEILDVRRPEPGEKTVTIRGTTVDAVDLNSVFGLPVPEATRQVCYAIVTQVSGGQVAMLVDEIVRQEDTVIKPFGSFMQELHHYSGTSTAGDGRLRLVVNPTWLAGAGYREEAEGEEVLLPPEPVKPKILVVDDSLSVRKIASLLLQNNGYDVVTASNGFEALDVLAEQNVQFILTDLEMPVMHGYELLAELGRRGLLEQIPVAVLTSRGGDVHRKKAFDLGATDYLVKPFEETSLLETIRRNIGARSGSA